MRVWFLAGGWSELYRGVAANPLDVHLIEILEIFDHGHYIVLVILIMIIWAMGAADESDGGGFVPWR